MCTRDSDGNNKVLCAAAEDAFISRGPGVNALLIYFLTFKMMPAL